ncbi:MAG: formate hydrogenlyase subunit 4 [Acidimicrobiales bacterium]|nr:formate hydrogenlyase subunit 4 [Acidimicrobiales bacterium]
MTMTPYIAYNIVQVIVVMIFSPLISGIITKGKERLQSRQGPSVLQPYRNIIKFFAKDEVVSETSSWISRFTPYIVFVTPIFVSLLIPVLTDYPLFLAFMADMVGVGFVLALSSFFATCAAVDGGNPYGPIGASRTRMVSFLAEPVFIIVFYTISFVAGSTIPYIVQQHWTTLGAFVSPSHILILVAFFMLIVAETGHLPVDNPSGHFELAMIDESKTLEYSGPSAALYLWGSNMKLFVLLIVFSNVLASPWGLASTTNLIQVVLAIPLILLKVIIASLLIIAVDSSLSKLRLFRITEFLMVSLSIAVVAVVVQLFTV